MSPPSSSRAPLAVTIGEPAGIGPDLCLALAQSGGAEAGLVFVGDPRTLAARADRLGLDVPVVSWEPNRQPAAVAGLRVLPVELPEPAVCGHPDPANARGLLAGLERAVQGCLAGEFSALVTAPLQKSTINDAGIPFSGHTEYLAQLTGTPLPVMLLVAGKLRVALATTHLPLKEVPAAITQDRLRDVIRVLERDLRRRFGVAKPAIVVCGLNPHAGEGGHLGSEDRDTIAPVIDELRAEGLNLRGPLPADTAFTPAAGPADAVLAMYHDQGLPVLKYAGFGQAVNVTLGLPIVRTSVDHGTALDVAGSGRADAGSMRAAILLARRLAAA